jgi:uncharacterized protein Yka (UPF0111/DUF47 family)
MENLKKTISVETPIHDQVKALAREMKVSRSTVVALAIKEFARKHKKLKLLDQINAAYEKETDHTEDELRRRLRRQHRRIVEGEW